MYANKNNLRSELTANVSSSATSISITSGEGSLWEINTVACLEHYENDICTKREIVKITAKSTDTLTITRGFAVCIMNDNTKTQGDTAQDFSTGDFLSLYLSKELWESITTGITTNETNTATMIANITAPKTCINNCCQDWKDAIDCAYISKYCGVAGFGTGADGDCVITADEFLCASCEYNFNNLIICDGVTVRFCGSGTPTINVWNNFKNCGVIDMRAPYLQAGSSSQTDCWLEAGCEICNQCECLTGIASEGGLYCGGIGACGTCDGCGATCDHGGDGGGNPGSYSGNNGGNGITSGCFGTGGGGAFGIGTGGKGGDGSRIGGDGGNGFYGGDGGDKTGADSGGGGNGGIGVIKGGNAGGGRGSCDYTTMGNGGNAITNVYGLHLNARNIYNNCVNARGGDGGDGGEYKRYGTSGGYAPTGGCGGNGADGGQMLISYENMCEQGCFDVSGGKGGIGGKIGFSCETCWCYEQPDGTDGNNGWVVFKSSRSPYISNFILTDDAGNQVVLINWKDPGIISWNKTMVRYSITDYPATITDGTLAIEETTKNQYFSTPYSLTGLSNQTTYYFTAFALDSDNNIIDSETATITTQWGWQPGVNTLLYLPLESDFVDMSGQGTTRTFTTSGLSYTTVGGVPSMHVGSTGGALLTSPYPLVTIATTEQTISVLIYVTTQQSSSRRVVFEFRVRNYIGCAIMLQGNTSNIVVSGNGDTVTAPITANSWMHIVLTNSSAGINLYKDGVLVSSGTGSATPRGNRAQTYENNQTLFNSRDGLSASQALNGNARELIMENRVWTAQEVADYYTLIKSQLGI